MAMKGQDLHIRIEPELKERLSSAAGKFTTFTDGRKKMDQLKVAELCRACFEIVLGMIEEGLPIVGAPSLVERGATQQIPDGGGVYRTPLLSVELYRRLALSGDVYNNAEKQLSNGDRRRLDVDAHHVKVGALVVVRGVVWTTEPTARKNSTTFEVLKVKNKRAQIRAGGEDAIHDVHVYDLLPVAAEYDPLGHLLEEWDGSERRQELDELEEGLHKLRRMLGWESQPAEQ